MPSNIQVFVKWKDQTIFAGENVECTITFKNVAKTESEASNLEGGQHQRKVSRVANHVGNHTGKSNSDSFFSFKNPQSLFSGRRSYSISSQRKPQRTVSSLSSPLVASHSFPQVVAPLLPEDGNRATDTNDPCQFFLLIAKLNLQTLLLRSRPGVTGARRVSKSPPGGTIAMMILIEKRLTLAVYTVARTPVLPFSLEESPNESTPGNLKVDTTHFDRSSRLGSNGISPLAPNEPSRPPYRRPKPPQFDFKFPSAPPTTDPHYRPALTPSPTSAESTVFPGKSPSRDALGLSTPAHQQLARVISANSVNGSRSSGEFYSASDHSTETLASEYTNYSSQGARAPPPARHARHYSSVVASPTRLTDNNNNQSLLMGYAQISASFTVDGSLSLTKSKGRRVMGGHPGTGGLPGRPSQASSERRKGGGFWGALKWNAIEESINGLISNNELDGLREMRGVASSRSIPLLSTPQSLLFVDLRLAPGEEQSYSFSFSLPRGLPASHKGKAIKIAYNLVIGTQRPSGPNEAQRVNRINIPFRVYSGVNEKGDVLGHDLMSPYVLLRDEAKVHKVGSNTTLDLKTPSIGGQWHSAGDFLSYVDEILDQRARSNLLYPPGVVPERQPSYDGLPHALSCKDIIDFAILRSNQAAQSRRSPNRFEIARDGQRIAVVVLNRPVHRLGETIIATVDFDKASIPCYAVRASLETSEKIVPTLAVRSVASIHRTTRRIHASLFENTLYATRVVFSPAIPISATPTILTSGVTLDWDLRFEFVTPNVPNEQGSGLSGTQLLETISSDDRGKVMSAIEHLGCESFEISIPLTVYGETVREPLPEEKEGYPI
ncbi:Reduced growth phenotype protein 1 [Penicillium taxi]|uniref:Reduced growth phenotype protein 1 n=1 Tax=Penicillium taxi TaxID=168475 RepID=UPI002544D9E6|nr:Reduced growth phenotype protein 1 [Penicillium taxi]KAJ5907403.1 Reduced growth phenotype protein 1 [Penicillium taxi]